jgi:uncharacterized protein involved in type VI secretion and phage assembly
MIPFNPLEIHSYQQDMNGVVVAIVTNNRDPDGLGRIKVKYPWNENEGESYWARVVSSMAGKDRGIFFLPEVDDEVLVSFELGNMESPIVLGALWNGKDTPIEINENGENNIQKIKSRSGLEIIFDDTSNSEKLEIKSKSGHKITLDDSSGGEKITMEDKNGNSIELDALTNTITLKSSMKLSIEANIIDIKADSVLTLQGSVVKIN